MKQYETTIDEAIIDELFEKDNKMGWEELKTNIEKRLKRSISFDAFDYRRKQMTKEQKSKNPRYIVNPVLNREDQGRGKKVFYSLTEDAKTRCRLKLPILKLLDATTTTIMTGAKYCYYCYCCCYCHCHCHCYY